MLHNVTASPSPGGNPARTRLTASFSFSSCTRAPQTWAAGTAPVLAACFSMLMAWSLLGFCVAVAPVHSQTRVEVLATPVVLRECLNRPGYSNSRFEHARATVSPEAGPDVAKILLCWPTCRSLHEEFNISNWHVQVKVGAMEGLNSE